MGHNVKIKYYARENTKMTPHSFFAQPIPNGTYGFEEICNEAAENTTSRRAPSGSRWSSI